MSHTLTSETNTTSTSQPTRTKTQKNLSLWVTSPLIEVGCGDCLIDQAPKNTDVISLTGCKSQPYTTWNTIGRDYIPAIAYIAPTQPSNISSTNDETDYITDPKHALVVSLGKTAVRKVYDGKYGVHRTTGVLSRLVQRRTKRAINDEDASAADSEDQPTESSSPPPSVPTSQPVQATTSNSGNGSSPKTVPTNSTPTPNSGSFDGHYTVVQDIPVRVATTSSFRQLGESDPAHSPYPNELFERLIEPHATGALASMVRAPNIRDAASIVSLAKYVRTASCTARETAAATRALTMIHSLDHAVHKSDPNRHAVVRGFTENAFTGPHINANPALQRLRGGRICAVPLDLAIQIAINKIEPGELPNFPYNRMDVDWCMVPVRQTYLNNSSVLAFVIAHATSEYYSGCINYYSSGQYLTADGQNLPAVLTCLPSGNSCHIPGPKNIMLVLLDCSSTSTPDNVLLGDADYVVPVVRLPNVLVDADLSEMWEDYFTDANINRLQRDFLGAYAELSTNFSNTTAIGTALSIAAELWHAQDTGLILNVTPDGFSDPTQAAHGAWTHGGQAMGPDNFRLSTNAWPADPASDDACLALTGNGFRKLTPLHRLATGRVASIFRIIRFGNMQCVEIGWGTRRPTVSYNGYKLPTLSSAMRLSVATNLISIGHQRYHFTRAGPLSLRASVYRLTSLRKVPSSEMSFPNPQPHLVLYDSPAISVLGAPPLVPQRIISL